MRVLVSGANGFVGRSVLGRLSSRTGVEAVAITRSPMVGLPISVINLQITGMESQQDWHPALAGVDVVIHCAARVHVMNDVEVDPLSAFRKVTVDGTLHLARQAALAGVRRFIFVSSIKASGEETVLGVPYVADAQASPIDPYGVSKLEAEQGLLALAAEMGMEVVIIRPVLVYGPGVKANFLNMMLWLHRGLPLPFGAIHNKRSLVALDNLVDLLVTCIDHPAAANQIFLVSDGEDLSTTELLRRMGAALGKPARLVPVPSWLFEHGAAIFGRQDLARRLCGSLQVDINKTRELLGWVPPVSVDEALRRASEHFLAQQKSAQRL